MLGVLPFLRKKEKPTDIRHIAISIKELVGWAKKNEKDLKEILQKRDTIILNIIDSLVKKNIPIITFYVEFDAQPDTEEYKQLMDSLTTLFNNLMAGDIIRGNKVKISVIGKWYSLPGMVVEAIKETIEETKEYDKFFLNFCINYYGQDEIVDAFKIILKNIKEGKISEENITKEVIKENISTSYFTPPDIIVETGLDNRYSGLLLWDSPNAKIYFTEKLFIDIEQGDIIKIIQ